MKSFDLSYAFNPAVIALQNNHLDLAEIVRSLDFSGSSEETIQHKLIEAIKVRDILNFVDLASKPNREATLHVLSLFPSITKLQTLKTVISNIAALLSQCDEDSRYVDQVVVLNLDALDEYFPKKLANMHISQKLMKYIDLAQLQKDFLAELGDGYVEIETPDGIQKFANREKIKGFIG